MRRRLPQAVGAPGVLPVSLPTVALAAAATLLLVTVSSVRYLAVAIASRHHASAHDEAVLFMRDKVSWRDTWGRTVVHIDETIRRHPSHEGQGEVVDGISSSHDRAESDVSSGDASAQKPQPQSVAGQKPEQRQSRPAVKLTSPPVARPSAGDQGPGSCRVELQDRTEFWGDVVGEWGSNRKLDSAEECCVACQSYTPPTPEDPPCNVWVYCSREAECKHQYKECWLKHLAWTGASKPNTGPQVPWTSGLVKDGDHDADQAEEAATQDVNPAERAFHTVTSAQGSATHWQMRVHYYWWKKRKAECQAQGNCMMGGFTRLLHSGVRDDLMGEIPTVVVNPLPKDTPNHGYVVLNRPYAFVQWLQKSPPPEKYILMSEPDHVFLKPMPNLMKGEHPAAFPFFYIEPAKPEFKHITEKFVGPLSRTEAERIAPIGSSPTFLATEDLKRVAPVWMNMSIDIFNDAEANKAWGWVLEMYGFTLALYKVGLHHVDVHIKMMAQPPWDTEIEPYYILHYTYGMDYTKEGVFTPGKFGEWRFDKRTYSARPIPRHLDPPPPGCENHLVRALIGMFNEATDNIPGWDTYTKTYRP